MADLDLTQVRMFSKELRDMPKRQYGEIVDLTRDSIKGVAAAGRELAPSDRPWLSTTRGVVVDVRRAKGIASGSAFSPHDPRGRNVGLHVETGTSEQPPQPFLTPPFTAARQPYVDGILAIIDRDLR